MYREIIELETTTPENVLDEIKAICEKAHNNRAGEVKLKQIDEHSFCFEGTEKDYGCLMLGSYSLNEDMLFRNYIKNWFWEDEEPGESCDILASLAMPVVV